MTGGTETPRPEPPQVDALRRALQNPEQTERQQASPNDKADAGARDRIKGANEKTKEYKQRVAATAQQALDYFKSDTGGTMDKDGALQKLNTIAQETGSALRFQLGADGKVQVSEYRQQQNMTQEFEQAVDSLHLSPDERNKVRAIFDKLPDEIKSAMLTVVHAVEDKIIDIHTIISLHDNHLDDLAVLFSTDPADAARRTEALNKLNPEERELVEWLQSAASALKTKKSPEKPGADFTEKEREEMKKAAEADLKDGQAPGLVMMTHGVAVSGKEGSYSVRAPKTRLEEGMNRIMGLLTWIASFMKKEGGGGGGGSGGAGGSKEQSPGDKSQEKGKGILSQAGAKEQNGVHSLDGDAGGNWKGVEFRNNGGKWEWQGVKKDGGKEGWKPAGTSSFPLKEYASQHGVELTDGQENLRKQWNELGKELGKLNEEFDKAKQETEKKDQNQKEEKNEKIRAEKRSEVEKTIGSISGMTREGENFFFDDNGVDDFRIRFDVLGNEGKGAWMWQEQDEGSTWHKATKEAGKDRYDDSGTFTFEKEINGILDRIEEIEKSIDKKHS